MKRKRVYYSLHYTISYKGNDAFTALLWQRLACRGRMSSHHFVTLHNTWANYYCTFVADIILNPSCLHRLQSPTVWFWINYSRWKLMDGSALIDRHWNKACTVVESLKHLDIAVLHRKESVKVRKTQGLLVCVSVWVSEGNICSCFVRHLSCPTRHWLTLQSWEWNDDVCSTLRYVMLLSSFNLKQLAMHIVWNCDGQWDEEWLVGDLFKNPNSCTIP